MNDETRAKILAEILAMAEDEPIADDEFTVRDVMEATDPPLSRWQAAKRLSVPVDKGKLGKRRVVVRGAWCNVYKII